MTAGFSPTVRGENLARMETQAWDLLVVGGGIVGAGISRDAALRGLSVALVERGDFAGGTSGKTSRLVHGGLRYLKNFKVGLVRQAVRERDTLLRRAPALVRPVAFTIPAYQGRGMGKTTLRFGLWVYDFLSRDKILPRRRWLRSGDVRTREPGLRGDALKGGGVYYDALTNDARLVLAVHRAAADAGAVAANYAEVVELVREHGHVVGARVQDRIGNRTLDVRASMVVNATGVWLDRIRQRTETPPTLRPTKGIHIFLPREKIGNHEAVVLTAPRDGRMLFLLPWDTLTLVGTTDTDFQGNPNEVLPDADDVAYLLEAVNEVFPNARVGLEDVRSAYAGLRPLIQEGEPKEESDISREHEIFEDPDGLVSVAGGKLTTQRAMAQEVLDRVCTRLGRGGPCRTRETTLGPLGDAAQGIRELGFDEDAATFLATRHSLADLAPWLDEPSAREQIDPSLPYRWIEVPAAVEAEMAMTLEDVMVRRLGLFYEASDQGLVLARAVAERIAGHLGWDETRVVHEVQAYRGLVAAHRAFREGHDR